MAVSLGTATKLTGALGQNPLVSHVHAGGQELLVFVMARLNSVTTVPTSVTFNGAAMTQVVQSAAGGTAPAQRAWAYSLADPGAMTADVQVNWPNTDNLGTSIVAIDVAGSLTGASMIDSSGSAAYASGGSQATTFTRTASDTLTAMVVCRGRATTAVTFTPTAPLNEIEDVDGPNNTQSWTLATCQESTSGSLTRTETSSSGGKSAAVAVAIATGPTAISGSLSATLDALTCSSAATLSVKGSLSATLGALTLSATSRDGKGDLSATLGALTLSSGSKLAISGALSATLGAVTLSASSSDNKGNLTATLGAVTLSSTSKLAISAGLAATLGAITAAGAGKLAIKGTLSATLEGVSLSGSGVLAIKGTLSKTLGAITLAGHGTDKAESFGGLAVTLGGMTLSSGARLRDRQPVIPRSFLLRRDIPSVKRTKVGHRGVRRFR